jgi:hypothetical protein
LLEESEELKDYLGWCSGFTTGNTSHDYSCRLSYYHFGSWRVAVRMWRNMAKVAFQVLLSRGRKEEPFVPQGVMEVVLGNVSHIKLTGDRARLGTANTFSERVKSLGTRCLPRERMRDTSTYLIKPFLRVCSFPKNIRYLKVSLQWTI